MTIHSDPSGRRCERVRTQIISPELRGVDTDQAPPRWEWPNDPAIRELLSLRQRAAAEVERLLSLLDELDGDPDLEPYLASNGDMVADDREDQCEDEGEDERENDPAEMGIADADGVYEFHCDSAATMAFRDCRAIRETGRPVPEPAWNGSPPRQIDDKWRQTDRSFRLPDGSWIVSHRGEKYRVAAVAHDRRP